MAASAVGSVTANPVQNLEEVVGQMLIGVLAHNLSKEAVAMAVMDDLAHKL